MESNLPKDPSAQRFAHDVFRPFMTPGVARALEVIERLFNNQFHAGITRPSLSMGELRDTEVAKLASRRGWKSVEAEFAMALRRAGESMTGPDGTRWPPLAPQLTQEGVRELQDAIAALERQLVGLTAADLSPQVRTAADNLRRSATFFAKTLGGEFDHPKSLNDRRPRAGREVSPVRLPVSDDAQFREIFEGYLSTAHLRSMEFRLRELGRLPNGAKPTIGDFKRTPWHQLFPSRAESGARNLGTGLQNDLVVWMTLMNLQLENGPDGKPWPALDSAVSAFSGAPDVVAIDR